MHHIPLRIQITALLVAVAILFGWVHCSLDLGCSDEGSCPALCQMCICHSPAIAEAKPVLLQPGVRIVEHIAEIFEPNARLSVVSIFNPPKA